MKRNRLVRVAAPGLPPHPALMFDPRSRRARVSARHPTWESHEWALYATEAIVWLSVGSIGWKIWTELPGTDFRLRALVLLIVVGVTLPAARFAFGAAVKPFLARRVFCSRTVLLFAPEAVIVRSRLYARPVVVWRKWRGQPVRVRFIVQSDQGAQRHLGGCGPKRRLPVDHLRDSRVLELLLTTTNRQRNTDFERQGSLLRSIPVTEGDSRFATQAAMVYAAAITLTSPHQKPQPGGPRSGADIDAA